MMRRHPYLMTIGTALAAALAASALGAQYAGAGMSGSASARARASARTGADESSLLSAERLRVGVSRPVMAGENDSTSRRHHKSPLVAGALGFVLPGAGHLYAGEPKRGWLIMGVFGVSGWFALTDGTPRGVSTPAAVIFLGSWAASVIDAPLAAKRHNAR